MRRQNIKTIIIVNDAFSIDGSREIAKKYSDTLIVKRTSISEGRNIVIKEALKLNKKYIVMVNSDIELPNNWIKKAIRIMEMHNDLGALGGYQKIQINNPIDLVISELLGLPALYKLGKSFISKELIDSQNVPCEAVIYRANVIKFLIKNYGNVFDEKLSAGEDPELSYRIRNLGFRTCLSPKLVFLHKMKSSIKKFVSQQILYGKGLYDWKIKKFNFDYKNRGINILAPKNIVTKKPYLLPLYYYLFSIKLLSNLYGFIKRKWEMESYMIKKYNKSSILTNVKKF